jgi:peptide/nickel transport system substrate-binding protein/oligopeptide transport system substrate-binding protein
MDEVDGWFPNALDIHPFKYLAFKNFRPLPGTVKAPQRGGALLRNGAIDRKSVV